MRAFPPGKAALRRWLYETMSAAKAKALRERFEFAYTPRHGSWLNMAK
jgi:hypothetical protein